LEKNGKYKIYLKDYIHAITRNNLKGTIYAGILYGVGWRTISCLGYVKITPEFS